VFQDAAGTLRNSIVRNQLDCTELAHPGPYGAGVVAFSSGKQGDASVTIAGNTISNFAFFGIGALEQTATISYNTLSNPDNAALAAIEMYLTSDSKVPGNTISVPAGSKSVPGASGIASQNDADLTVTLNNISNICSSIELENDGHATVNFNIINDPCSGTISVGGYCIEQSSIVFNTITGLPGPPPPTPQVSLYSTAPRRNPIGGLVTIRSC
jgi:hypothetical protein